MREQSGPFECAIRGIVQEVVPPAASCDGAIKAMSRVNDLVR